MMAHPPCLDLPFTNTYSRGEKERTRRRKRRRRRRRESLPHIFTAKTASVVETVRDGAVCGQQSAAFPLMDPRRKGGIW